MNIEQNIYVCPATQRRPSVVGNVVVMLIGISALVTAGWLLFVVGTGLLNMLGYALGGLAGATVGIAGWLGTNVPPVAAALAAGLPAAIWGIVRGLAILSLWGVGGYIVWHGVQYAIAEQRHRHALQAQRAMTVVEYANRLAEPTHITHMLPVAQRGSDEIVIEAKEYQSIGR